MKFFIAPILWGVGGYIMQKGFHVTDVVAFSLYGYICGILAISWIGWKD